MKMNQSAKAITILLAACVAAMTTACSGGGKGGDEMLTISVSVPPEIGGVVKLKDGRASILFNSAMIAQDLAIEIGEEPGSGQATLKIEFPAKLLAAYAPVAGAPRRQEAEAVQDETATTEAAALPTSGTLGINVTEPGGVLLMAISGSIDFSGSSPIVAMNSDGIVYVDSDGDGAPNWLEVFLNTNALSASEAPPQEAIDGAIGSLTETFTTSVASGDTTTGGVSGSDVPVSGDGTTGTDSTTGGATTPAGGEPNTTLSAKPAPFTKVNTAQFKFGTDTGAKFQCALDTAAFADCNSPVNYSSLAEGRHTFKVRAVSADGTADSTPASYTWTVDTILPSLTIEGLPVVVVNVTTQTATFVCSEADCAYLCGLDGASPAGCSSPYTMNTLADGEHTLAVKSVDQAGNESSPASSATFTIDTVPPAKPDAAKVTVTSNAVGTADQVKSAAAGVEGGTTVKVYSDGLLTDKLAETTAKADGSFDAVNIGDNKGDSSDKVHVVAIDAAGNMSAVLSLTNDKTPPAAGTISLKDQTSGSTAYTNGVAVDAVLTGPADAAAWFLTEGAAPAATASGWISTQPTTLSLSTADGSKTVNLYVKDAAHNMSPVASASITLDTVPPVNPTLTLKDANCSTCTATNGTGVDVVVGNDTTDVTAWLLSEALSTAPSESDGGWGSEPVSFNLSDGEGTKTVYSWVKDAAGNMNAGPISAAIIYDTTVPTITNITLSSTDSGTHVDGTFTITATISDPGTLPSGIASCDYRTLAAGSYSPATVAGSNCTMTAATCADGTALSINIQATDNAGNNAAGSSVARTCDAAAPTAITDLSETPGASQIALAWTASGDGGGSGLDASTPYVVYYDTDQTGSPYNGTGAAEGSSGSVTSTTANKTLTGLSNGVYYLAVKAQDKVGNLSAFSNEVKVYVTPNAADGLGHVKADGTMDYTSSCPNGPGREGFRTPNGVALDTTGRRLFVTDQTNHRILVYQLGASLDFAGVDRKADNVLGQPDFSTCASATTQAGLSSPGGLAYSGGKLFAADTGNNRVVIYDAGTITNGENAVNVLGQANFTTGTAGTTQGTLKSPDSVAVLAGLNRLFVSDRGNHRVMVFDIAVITDGENAVNVLGQANFTTGTANRGATTDTNTLSTPVGIAVHEATNRLYVADRNNNRVLIFNVGVITDGMGADYVLGQTLWTGNGLATTQGGMNLPMGVARADEAVAALYVADSTNHRVLRFDLDVITNGENAVNVLGQANFTTGTGGTAVNKMTSPQMMAIASNKLYVVDSTNHRVVLFDTATVTDGEDASDGVGHLDASGQPVWDITCPEGRNAAGFTLTSGLGDVALDLTGHRLFASDPGNHRVLVFNLSVTDDFTGVDREADFVLGQADFAHCGANRGGAVAANTLNTPTSLLHYGANNQLYVSDNANHRVVVYDVAALSNGESAVNVLGQANLTSNTAATTQAGLSAPEGLALGGGTLYVADRGNHRMVTYNVGDGITDGENAVNVLGQANFTTGTANRGGVTAINSLWSPSGISLDTTNNKLYVADNENHRVIVYDVAAILDGENAVNVLGQSGFGGNTGASTRAGLNAPYGASYLGGRLFVGENTNHRVIVYDVAAIVNGEDAVNVLGQATYTANAAGTTRSAFNTPQLIRALGGNKLWVGDASNRFLLFNVP